MMITQIINIAKLVLKEALFAKLHWQLVAILVGVISISVFTADLALTAAASVQLSILAEFLRIFFVLIFIIFIVSSSIREFEEGRVSLCLAGPTPRWMYWTGRALAVGILAFIFAVLAAGVVLYFSSLLPGVVWACSLFLELFIVGLAAIFFSFSFRHLAAAITGMIAFYLVSRMLSSVLVIITNSQSLDHELVTTQFVDGFITGLSYIIPPLDQFSQSVWLMSDVVQTSVLSSLLLQTLIYSSLLAAASLFDLYRKEFI